MNTNKMHVCKKFKYQSSYSKNIHKIIVRNSNDDN